jgi:hypothetical protein
MTVAPLVGHRVHLATSERCTAAAIAWARRIADGGGPPSSTAALPAMPRVLSKFSTEHTPSCAALTSYIAREQFVYLSL